jgi:hypothetical protein
MATYVHSGYLQSAAAATGNGDSLDVRGMSAAGVQLTITNTATVTFEGSLDGSTWVAIPFTNRATGVESSTASASGLFVAGVAGVGFIRARVSAWTSGTVTALAQASTGGDPDQESDARMVVGSSNVLDVTLSLDTSAYASGDVLADTQVVNGALRVSDGTGILQSVTLIDKDDQGVALYLYFLSANVVMGTENAAPSISDTDAASILGVVAIATSDYQDLGGARVATKTGVGLAIKAVSGTDDIYVAAVNGTGTPTYSAGGLVLRLGLLRD